jgi:uncharacterized protein (TIGR02757 family)
LSRRSLETRLSALVAAYGPARLSRDPLSLVRPYPDDRDREVAGLVASSLAFGSVSQVLRSASRVLSALGPRPARSAGLARTAAALRDFRHRWVTGGDVARMLAVAARIQAEWGSVEEFFLEGFGGEVGPALTSFSRRAKEMVGDDGGNGRGFRYLFPEPAGGSAAKRLCLFLRWMARPDDGLDLGVWTRLPPSALVIPLDTHVLRISRHLGLTSRRTASWATARDITAGLRELSPADPVRYDFAIAQLGISRDCRHRYDQAACGACPLREVCSLANP